MDISRRCDYACRMLRAAHNSDGGYRSVSEIANSEHIPYSFARSIQHDLVKAGLIKAIRGAHGGIALSCDPVQVTLLDVLEAVQGKVSIALCTADDYHCELQAGCGFNRVWQGADRLLREYFASFVLADVLTMDGDSPLFAHPRNDTGSCEHKGDHRDVSPASDPASAAAAPLASAEGACFEG